MCSRDPFCPKAWNLFHADGTAVPPSGVLRQIEGLIPPKLEDVQKETAALFGSSRPSAFLDHHGTTPTVHKAVSLLKSSFRGLLEEQLFTPSRYTPHILCHLPHKLAEEREGPAGPDADDPEPPNAKGTTHLAQRRHAVRSYLAAAERVLASIKTQVDN